MPICLAVGSAAADHGDEDYPCSESEEAAGRILRYDDIQGTVELIEVSSMPPGIIQCPVIGAALEGKGSSEGTVQGDAG